MRPPVGTPLDPQKTHALTLGPPVAEARAAVLLLHGFTGSPWELALLAESLAAKGFHVRVPRLPGHGTVPEDLLWVGWRDWEAAAVAELEALAAARRVVVGGLSMGGLLAVLLAARARRRVDGLVLLAPVVTLQALEAQALRVLRHWPFQGLRQRWVSKSGVDLDDARQRAEAPVLPRYPLGRLFDLFALQDEAWRVLPQVHVPALVVAARHDHVVKLAGVERFQAQLSNSRLVTLARGFHQVARDHDRALVFAEVGRLVEEAAAR